MKKIKPILFILLFLIILFVMGKTIAYYQTSDSFNNSFSASNYIMEVKETFVPPTNWLPGDTTPKTIIATNRGNTPAAVRVKLNHNWIDSNGDPLPLKYNGEDVAIINFTDDSKWIYEDGYYYYKYLLNKDESTTSLIESVTFNPNVSLETTTTCTTNNETHQKTCKSTSSGYNGASYGLDIETQTVQHDKYEEAWDTEVVITEPKYLYDVLKTASEDGTYAKKYTGEHQDSYDASGDKDIYYWWADNDTNGTAITDKYNVIFGNHCWQMLRTTDTGGVKMIYNGEVENDQCLDTRGNHVGYNNTSLINLSSNYYYGTSYTYDKTTNQFSLSGTLEQSTWSDSTYQNLIGKYTCKQTTSTGTCSSLFFVESYNNNIAAHVIKIDENSIYSRFGSLQFYTNISANSPAYVGYMNNTVYLQQSKTFSTSETILSNMSLSTTYWYANSINWNSSTNKYELVNPYQVTSTADYPNLVGKYTFANTNQSYTNISVYYIAEVNNTTMYYLQLYNSTNHNLSDVNDMYTYGNTYTDNGNGTYTITNSTTIYKNNWYTNYNNVKNKYVCKNTVNDICSELRYVIKTSNTNMQYISVSNNYKYSNGFTYDENTNTYLLNNDSVHFWNIMDTVNQTSINTHHYTCFNENGVCQTISYIYYYYYRNAPTLYYINLENGKNVNDALNEMLYANNVNTKDSTMKLGVEAWYEKYMLSYDSYIEDTIFCNNRSIKSLNGWNSINGTISNSLLFKEYDATSDLSCTNETDRFSTLNNKAKLKYKVGLMSRPEINILNNNNIRKSDSPFWLISPRVFDDYRAYIWVVTTSGSWNDAAVGTNYSVRPAISLKPNITYLSGDGSKESPYIVETN